MTRKIDDLIDRSGGTASAGGPAAGPAAPPAGPAAPPPPTAQMQQVNRNPTAVDMGEVMTDTMRNCKPGDTSPVGAVVDGFRKTNVATPFGPICRWMK